MRLAVARLNKNLHIHYYYYHHALPGRTNTNESHAYIVLNDVVALYKVVIVGHIFVSVVTQFTSLYTISHVLRKSIVLGW